MLGSLNPTFQLRPTLSESMTIVCFGLVIGGAADSGAATSTRSAADGAALGRGALTRDAGASGVAWRSGS